MFAVVNVAVLVLRKDVQADGKHFKTPTWLPVVGFVDVAVSGVAAVRSTVQQYVVLARLDLLGIVLFGITLAINKQLGRTGRRHHRSDASWRCAEIEVAHIL